MRELLGLSAQGWSDLIWVCCVLSVFVFLWGLLPDERDRPYM